MKVSKVCCTGYEALLGPGLWLKAGYVKTQSAPRDMAWRMAVGLRVADPERAARGAGPVSTGMGEAQAVGEKGWLP